MGALLAAVKAPIVYTLGRELTISPDLVTEGADRVDRGRGALLQGSHGCLSRHLHRSCINHPKVKNNRSGAGIAGGAGASSIMEYVNYLRRA
jgi:hypothetical protein